MQSRGDDGNLLLNQMAQQHIFFSFFFFLPFSPCYSKKPPQVTRQVVEEYIFSLVIGAQSVDMDDLGFKNRFYSDYHQPPATACS